MKFNYPLQVVFYKTQTGIEPTRDWLRNLSKQEKRVLGKDIKIVQFSWPLGFPLVKKLEPGLWEIRSRAGHKIFRIIFTIYQNYIVLLHGFVKKSQKIPEQDLALARERKKQLGG